MSGGGADPVRAYNMIQILIEPNSKDFVCKCILCPVVTLPYELVAIPIGLSLFFSLNYFINSL